MRYVASVITITDSENGPIPKCSCGWQDLPFYKHESAWHSAMLHLSFDSRHVNNRATSEWARQQLDARKLP